MPLYKRGDIFWIDVRVGGRRVRRSTGTADRKEAKRQHDELTARRWKIKQGGKLLSDALLAWHNAEPRKPSAKRALKQIRQHYKDRPLSEVTEASIEEVFGSKSPGTYNKLAAIIRASLNIAKDKGWLGEVPKIKRRQEPKHRLRYLTAEEWGKLREQLSPHLRDMADFAIATGLRWENVAGLEWSRVSIKRKTAWIPADSTKGGEDIVVPLSTAALRVLQRIEGERTGYVFLYKGERIRSPKTGFNAACRRAGIESVTWHTLRRTWASWHAMSGTPLEVLQKLGAWKSPEMVQVYAVLAPSYLAQFAGNAKPVATEMDTKAKRKQLSA